MSALQEYEDRVIFQMNEVAGDAKPGDPLVVGIFDWMALVGVLLPQLIDIVLGCLKPKSTAALAEELVNSKNNIWVRVKAQQAVNSTCKDCGCGCSATQKRKLADAVLNSVGNKEQALALLQEVKANSWAT